VEEAQKVCMNNPEMKLELPRIISAFVMPLTVSHSWMGVSETNKLKLLANLWVRSLQHAAAHFPYENEVQGCM
jgi:hypothetical protein